MSLTCDPEIYEKGEVALIVSLRAADMEAWVAKLRAVSNQRIDWHYVGGRAAVKFLGDADEVSKAIEQETPYLRELYHAELVDYDMAIFVGSGRKIAQNNLGPDIRD